jgi:hypothetical protein
MLSRYDDEEIERECIGRLYCGLSPDIAERMLCVVLEAFCDETENDQRYIVAGLIAPKQEWESIAPAWLDTLKLSPRLGFYRTSDSIALKGQFEHFNESQRDQRIAALARLLINGPNPQITRVAASISQEDFHKYCEPVFHPAWHDPYHLCAIRLIGSVCLDWLRYNPTRIDFIFEQQGKIGNYFKAVFDVAIKPFGMGLFFPFMGDVRLERKRDFLPLQAADMQAGWMRRSTSLIQAWTAADTYLRQIPERHYPAPRPWLEYINQFGTDHREEIQKAWADYLEKQLMK